MKFSIPMLALATLLTVACRSKHHDDHVIVEHASTQPTTVVVEREHVHSSTCGHFYHNGVWYAEPEHVRIVEIRRD